jgi:hypothetical protein
MENDKDIKFYKKIAEMIKTTGFYIIAKGDESVGIFDTSWTLLGDFYFDDQEDLEIFKTNLKTLYGDYCGEVTIETFEERNYIK